MSTSSTFLLAAFIASSFLPSPARADTAVTTCGQEFTGRGYLTGDLTCDGDGYAVEIEGSGSLDLRGFTITGGEYGVFCKIACKVFGGGTITGAVEDGVVAAKTVKVDGITVSNNGFTGVKGGRAAMVTNAVLTGNARAGVQGLIRAKLSDTTSQGNGYGAVGDTALTVIRSNVSGNLTGGVYSDRITARDSSIVDNDVDAQCGVTLTCADLETGIDSKKKPRVDTVTCGTSSKGVTLPAETWGVCSAD
jgi:hypothetical protein